MGEAAWRHEPVWKLLVPDMEICPQDLICTKISTSVSSGWVWVWRRSDTNVFLLNTIQVLAPVFSPQCVLKPRLQQALALPQCSEMGQKSERNGVLGDKGPLLGSHINCVEVLVLMSSMELIKRRLGSLL